MFSLNKILFLILILVVIWYGFKLIGRLDRARRNKLREQAPGKTRAQHRDDAGNTIDLERSPDGKSFVARDRDH